ncbi:MAG TPA: dTDP-4-dehydrorhamnose 3,5-epimerase [Deltaproteobacteria bacterium]|nr:dTDP-4-dehydrorhamnose 3,5-epimerase [Deltaproteobacteria bacterium]HPJ93047.1 dTDP-4-dehydrorhamnose 3,5-epimerase [Deltaproteobacteria bacterium]HPR50709.1 dTDP-4-dehydrorhamnose 3,5-epimerase [Deltaproteobacteria bacterium]
MNFIETDLKGAYVIQPVIHRDDRGFFVETFNQEMFGRNGIQAGFVQDNYSFSKQKGVLRGLHFQHAPHAQTKLVAVMTGSVWDVIIDLRKDSPTFLKWTGVELSSDDMTMLYVPKGFAHGFCTLQENTRVLYKVDAHYAPQADAGIRWDDPDLAIPWPCSSPILSAKDSTLPVLKDIAL